MRNVDDTFRRKIYNFYQKEESYKEVEQIYSNVILSDPLGEYKHFEKQDLEEQKIFEGKIQNKEVKADDQEEKAAASSTKEDATKKKKKCNFDDVVL